MASIDELYQFLFNCGTIDSRFFRDNLQLERSEYDIVNSASKAECLYKCGSERFYLEAKAPPHKAALFGTAGGRGAEAPAGFPGLPA